MDRGDALVADQPLVMANTKDFQKMMRQWRKCKDAARTAFPECE